MLDGDRKSGLLMPVYALPGPEAGGTFGPESYEFIRFLSAAGQRIWQILPLVSTGPDYSPYRGLSVFGGNPVFISLELLVQQGLLSDKDLPEPRSSSATFDYDAAIKAKQPLLKLAFEKFSRSNDSVQIRKFDRFCDVYGYWLDDFSFFMVLSEDQGSAQWTMWHKDLRDRKKKSLDRTRKIYAGEIRFQKFLQFIFFEQWMALKHYAQSNQVLIFGDLPIFVDHESADVWANPQLFALDEHKKPTEVAGVPPDYFSETGQLWGNPVYNWKRHKETGFKWWLDRLSWNTRLYDLVRIDHFRGFEAYWSVPYGAENAIDGKWNKAPGNQLLKKVRDQLGMGAFVAEDLGFITPEVEYLRERFGLPGMRVLQFAFDGEKNNTHLPHNHVQNCVAYTGTHDNDTLLGWYRSLKPGLKKKVVSYAGPGGSDVVWGLIRAVWRSSANISMTTMQDILGLGSGARTNFPGQQGKNWTWRMRDATYDKHITEALLEMTLLFER